MFSVTQFGKELDKSKYTWDGTTRTFSTNENNLIIDAQGWIGVTFNTGNYCVFKTSESCIFRTGFDCTFKTGSYCTFKAGWGCTFNVGEKCCLHYTWNDYFEVYKLPANETVKILSNGQLEKVIQKTETEIQIEKLEQELQTLKEKYLKEKK